MRSKLLRSIRGDDGQTLVELALILPIFLVVVVGVFDAGRAVYTNAALSQAAREGARLGAVEAGFVGLDTDDDPACVATPAQITSSNPGARVCPPTVASMKTDVVDAVNRMTVSLGDISAVYFSCNAGTGADPLPTGEWTESVGGNGCETGGNSLGASGEYISVRVVHTYQPITPIFGTILGPITLSGSATMIVN
jgi:Flp pilus assembly protein TadG